MCSNIGLNNKMRRKNFNMQNKIKTQVKKNQPNKYTY